MLEFDAPLAFLALPLPILVWWLTPPRRQRVQAIRLPFFERVSAGLPTGEGAVVPARRAVQIVFVALLWALAITTIARPVRLGDPVTRTEAARDIMLAVDISGSMETGDFIGSDGQRGTRMDGVKQVLDGFIAARKDDRVGMIAFGSAAYVLVPFTRDTTAARQLLATLSPGMAGQNTVLGDAIGLAIQSFAASNVDERVLILLSDGSDTSSRMAPAKAADIAAKNNVTIHTIAVGDPNGKDEQDRVDLATLQSIATTAGGTFNRAEDAAGLTRIYEQIDTLHPVEAKSVSWRPRLPLGQWTTAAFVLMTVLGYAWMLARRGWHRRTVGQHEKARAGSSDEAAA
ncbi:VWA domain-containing protein [Paracoccus sp. CPCC 101403]|uniref:VWA domain-containing protein n=1 Tax=Paracoccus broussonetiae TaxID=3075834 RepID=A0ABU3EJJ8_9RHOB|nr:VWA domain-containing protein [Paracoccus sp. CPCC 101403]MDT1064285.1 VWA domain-containing protein [Paracoccus sp. CPCC 101403]